MMHQAVFDTSEVLRQLGLQQAVICPGSRNAPLAVSFARNPQIESFSVVDERSAAFIALGMCLESGKPTAVCCTSGTALLNFAPAAAEAFYQEIPLVLISADRPPEWIGQRDGQTIQQHGALAPHVKASYQMPADLDHGDAQWEYRRKLQEAMMTAQQSPKGPVHINIPFREPFYPEDGQPLAFSKEIPGLTSLTATLQVTAENVRPFLDDWKVAHNKIIVLGQGTPEKDVLQSLSNLSANSHIPVIADVISNGTGMGEVVTGQDLFLSNKGLWESLQPDLVLTLGQSLISKQLKLMLRQGTKHWHLSSGERTSDTFQSLCGIIKAPLQGFVQLLAAETSNDKAYFEKWQSLQRQVTQLLEDRLSRQPFCDFVAMSEIMAALPSDVEVHLANSMAVRYANFFHRPGQQDVTYHANRGTSGIDGANSTAVGFAINSDKTNLLITGDLSFLYDRNAFLHDQVPDNLKVIVINNYGGGIFDLIPGPRRLSQEERTRYLGTTHQRTLRLFAEEESFAYYVAEDREGLQKGMASLFSSAGRGLLEVQTPQDANQAVYDRIKGSMMDLRVD